VSGSVVALNADLGESPEALVSGRDFELMRYITSANVACGGHAGDRSTMDTILRFAKEVNVAVGAHPAYPDPQNFGRVPVSMRADELEESICGQIVGLCEAAETVGVRIAHVKPHGALYHATNRDPSVAEAVGRAVARVDPNLILVGQAESRSLEFWRRIGFHCAAEAFADRVYEADGTLRARNNAGAIIEDAQSAAEQARSIVMDGKVCTHGGSLVAVHAETLCIHSDTRNVIDIARAIRRKLESAGIQLEALRR
jgi:5-oxoprolinase (ATP-hydrolysing) subunit A